MRNFRLEGAVDEELGVSGPFGPILSFLPPWLPHITTRLNLHRNKTTVVTVTTC